MMRPLTPTTAGRPCRPRSLHHPHRSRLVPRVATPGGMASIGSALGLGVLVAVVHLGSMVAGATSAAAQYTSLSGTSGLEPIPDPESFSEKIDDARWTFGALKIQPWLGLRDASYVSDQSVDGTGEGDEDESDFTATAGAGLRLYARASSKLLFTAHALPEYVWWQAIDRKSGWNGRYGVGVFGFYNRLRFELSHRLVEAQDFFSPELRLLTSTELRRSRAAVELEVSRGIILFATARNQDYSGNGEDNPIFTLLDRTEERFGVGVRIESAQGYWARVAYEESTLEFEEGARNLSNDGRTVGVGLGFAQERLQGSLDLAFDELEPVAGSAFQTFDDITGRFDLLWQPRRSFGLRFFGQRRLDYSVGSAQTYVLGTRTGAQVELRPGQAAFRLGYTVGEDEYGAILGATERNEDVTELEATLIFPVGDLLRVSLRAARLDYESSIPELDRDITRYGVGIELGRIVERLQLGDDSGTW